MFHHLDTTKKQFIGKALKRVERTGESEVAVEFADGITTLKISVSGDCCSTSIFYEIDCPFNVDGAILKDIAEGGWDETSLGHTTAGTEEVALQKIEASGIDFYKEVHSVWNVVLVTDRGNVLLRHINSSNGYYDGMTEYEVTEKLSSVPDGSESDTASFKQDSENTEAS